MTIKECKKRKKELKQIIESLDTLKLALIRSIAVEDLNIAELKTRGVNE